MASNLKKSISKNIAEKSRKEDLLQLVDDAKGTIKSYEKLKKEKRKKIKKLNKNRDIPSSVLYEKYISYHSQRLKMQQQLTEDRLQLQTMLTDDEWNIIMENATFSSEKKKNKHVKKEDKTEDKIHRLMQKVRKIFSQEVHEEAQLQKIMPAIDQFETSLIVMVNKRDRLNDEYQNFVKNRRANRAQLEAFYHDQNETRNSVAKNYADLRDTIAANTTEKEWKKVMRKLSAILK